MALAKTPLFDRISGSEAGVDFRTRRNGKIEIAKKRIPSNPQSTEQTNTRNAYGRLHELWQNAAWIDKTQYENIAAAYNISSWNAFLMRHLPTMRLNPVGYWPAVEGKNNILHDFTTNNNHGTIFGATWQQFEKYSIPRLYFDNIDDYVDLGNHTSLNPRDAITIKTYVNELKTSLSPTLSRYSSGNIAQSSYAWLRWDQNNIYFFLSDGNIRTATLSYPVQLNKFIDITETFKQPTATIRVNGNEIDSKILNYSLQASNLHTHIGFLNYYGNRFFHGIITEISMYDYILSSETDVKLHNNLTKFFEE